MRSQRPFRRVSGIDPLPSVVAVSGASPVAKLQPSIVGLPVELVGRADGPQVGDLPALVADNALGSAVSIGDLQLQNQHGRTEVPGVVHATPFSLRFVVTHGHVPSARQDDPDGIVPFLKESRHIVSIEIDPLVVVGEGGLEQLLRSDLRAVEEGTVLAQPADV